MTRQVKVIPELPQRAEDSHKGSMGRVVVVGGSLDEYGMLGAPSLTANAALRSGSGLVQVITSPQAQPYVGIMAPCATTRALPATDVDLSQMAVEFGADSVGVGPGLGKTITGSQVVKLLESFSGGIVVDADALNALSEVGDWRARWPDNVVITPHPGEMARLVAGRKLDLKVDDRQHCAVEFARATSVVVVLKGAGTVVTDGERVYINQTGNVGMATAGAGDVLTGVVAALLARNMPAFDAAVLGVYMHGLAGDAAAEQLGRTSLTAGDLIEYLPDAFCDHEYRSKP